jgi:hypothetical protein
MEGHYVDSFLELLCTATRITDTPMTALKEGARSPPACDNGGEVVPHAPSIFPYMSTATPGLGGRADARIGRLSVSVSAPCRFVMLNYPPPPQCRRTAR